MNDTTQAHELPELWRNEGIRLNGGADKPYTDDENSVRALVLACCAIDLDAALKASPVQAEAVAIVGERGSVPWRLERILAIGTPLYDDPKPPATSTEDVEAQARRFLAEAERGPENDYGHVHRQTAHAAIVAALRTRSGAGGVDAQDG